MKKLTLLTIMFFLLTIIGCGGGGGSAPSSTTTTSQANTTTLADAGTSFDGGDLNSAISKFNTVLINGGSNTEEQQAREGLGFSYLKMNNLDQAISNLEKATTSGDAGVALSSTYLSKSGTVKLNDAITTLTTTLEQNKSFNTGVVTTGVTSSQGNAMAALLLLLRGSAADVTKAATYKTTAQTTGNGDELTNHILEAIDLITQ